MRSALNPGPLKPQGRRPPRVSSSPFELTPAPLDSYGLHRQHRHDAHMLHTHGCTYSPFELPVEHVLTCHLQFSFCVCPQALYGRR